MRVHVADTLRDLVGVRGDKRAWTLRAAMRADCRQQCGVLVILRSGIARALADAIQGLAREARRRAGRGRTVLRTYGIGAQILKDLGVRRMRVLSRAQAAAGHLRLRPGSRGVRRDSDERGRPVMTDFAR